MTAQTMTNRHWVGGATNPNTRVDTNTPTNQTRSRAGDDALTHTLAVVDAWLWIVFALLIVARQAEQWFGVLSGFTLLVGPYPTMATGAALILGGAAYLAATMRAGDRLQRMLLSVRRGQPATVEATAPQWKVRTTPRPASKRSAASRRVMDMEV